MAYKGFDLTGKVALVTGGNGGIGLGMADALAEAGADVCIWGTRAEKNEKAVAQLEKHGRKVHAQTVDVGDEKQVIVRDAENKEHTFPAAEVESVTPSRLSLMPEGQMAGLTPQEAQLSSRW